MSRLYCATAQSYNTQCIDVGRLEHIAAAEDRQLFQTCLDDAEARTLEGLPSVTMTRAGLGHF